MRRTEEVAFCIFYRFSNSLKNRRRVYHMDCVNSSAGENIAEPNMLATQSTAVRLPNLVFVRI